MKIIHNKTVKKLSAYSGSRAPKLSLFVRCRKQGSRVESVPLKRLVELSGYRKKRWSFEDGWLILEAF
jgi:hypothetical protein